MSDDTSGFYKRDGDRLLHAPNFVLGPGFSLSRETHETETYPVDGWTWYDDAATAYADSGLVEYADAEDELDDLTVALIQGL